MVAMTYTSLVAPKGTAGSILNWVGYGKIDVDTCLTDAQALLWTMMRTREMRSMWTFGMAVGQSRIALPTGFLDPIGKLRCTTNGLRFEQKTQDQVTAARVYDNSFAGSFGNNPFTTGAVGSSLVTTVMANHGLTQGSDITIAGSAAPIDGITMNGTFPVDSIIDPNTFVIDSGQSATAGNVTGGGAAATWTADQLIETSPSIFAIWNEAYHFDGAFDTAVTFRQPYFKSLPLLSPTNPSNFLTNRYPHLVRQACAAAAALFMKDMDAFNAEQQIMSGIIDQINIADDMSYRGAELDVETPHG